MRTLIVFNHISLDGYFAAADGDFSWARAGNDDPEYSDFVAENASSGGQLLFGRITYDLMASYWPTALADQHNPAIAAGINKTSKVVFSRTLQTASWNNTRVVNGDIISEIRNMKQEPGPGMTILGSGSIVSQLAPEHVIDEYQIVINPVALGKGRTMFDGIPEKLNLQLTKSRTFRNGKVHLCFQPKR